MLVFHTLTGEELPIRVSKASSSPLLEPPPAAVAGDHLHRATKSAAKVLPGATPPGSDCLCIVRAPASPWTRLPSLPESERPACSPDAAAIRLCRRRQAPPHLCPDLPRAALRTEFHCHLASDPAGSCTPPPEQVPSPPAPVLPCFPCISSASGRTARSSSGPAPRLTALASCVGRPPLQLWPSTASS